jgi:hypothetical protein
MLVTSAGRPSTGPTAPGSTPPAQTPAASVATTGEGFVTVEVEPGLFRIVNDGVRDVAWPIRCDPSPYGCSGYDANLAAGRDGSVWVFRGDSFFRLGAPPTYPNDDRGPRGLDSRIEVTPDGALWWGTDVGMESATLVRFANGSAAPQGGPVRDLRLSAFDLGPDGAIWAVYDTAPCGDRSTLVRLDPGGWTELARPDLDSRFEVADVLPAAISREVLHADPAFALLRAQPDCADGPPGLDWVIGSSDGALEELPAIEDIDGVPLWDTDTADGFWAYVKDARLNDAGPYDGDMLVHVQDTTRRLYTQDDGIPLTTGGMYDWRAGFLRAAPDGTVWIAGTVTPSGVRKWEGDGLAHFDGTTTTRYLAGHSILALEIAPDGAVWAQAAARFDSGPVELYRIPPDQP